MVLVVGLGNPGPKYANTRHNAGFMFVDHFRSLYFPDSPWQENKKLSSLVCRPTSQSFQVSSFKFQVLLAQPQTFMNSSGLAVKKLIDFYKISFKPTTYHLQPTTFFVAHDDLDIRLGDFKLQFATGPKDHKGLQSVYHHLKTDQFWHLRLGVDNRPSQTGQSKQARRSPDYRIPGETYVLQPFPREELQIFNSVLDQASSTLLQNLSSH